MKAQTWFTSIGVCLVLGFISKAPCLGQQLPDDDLDDLEDYYDDTEIDDEEAADLQDPLPDPVTDPPFIDAPYFEQSNVQISSLPHSDVVMNCDVRNFHVNNVVIWYKDTTAIVNGHWPLNTRYESMKNNSILLRNVQPADAGHYYCAILPQNITLNIVLTVEKALTIRCDGRDVLDRVIVYRQGESHICECKTPGTTANNIKWFLNNRKAHDMEIEVDEDSILLSDIDDIHSGIYQCLDDDGSSKPRHGIFEIIVHFAPKVTTHRHHVNTEIGGTANIYCDYRGDPISVTRWIKNNYGLSYSEKHMITYSAEGHFNRTTLTIQDVGIDDLGEYKCQAENSIGSSELKVHLMLEPEKGQLEDFNINGSIVTLHWLVRSVQPLSEAVMDYKMEGAYTWSSTTVLHTQRHEGGIWKVTHEMELVPGEWQIRMKTKNTMGWSKFSNPQMFTIHDDEDIDPDNLRQSGQILAAGIGLGGNNTAAVVTQSCHPLNSVLIILLTMFLRAQVIN